MVEYLKNKNKKFYVLQIVTESIPTLIKLRHIYLLNRVILFFKGGYDKI